MKSHTVPRPERHIMDSLHLFKKVDDLRALTEDDITFEIVVKRKLDQPDQ